ncbi:serine hydrolase [Fibrella aquatilis]|uniref:Serine hydrolase n=1 Tax=Fibrella aquatilis TaxID=2817059 RepID=A0A939G7S1_9BACT|nr:serine hydrolase [Fibrella aquatilis]MBO0933769.1 serine hydrolase [Fibrella aquatilis]
MKQSLLAVICLLSQLPAFRVQAQPARTIAEKADEYLTASASLHRFNGTVLIAQKGTVLLQKGYGWRNQSTKTPNDTGSIYQLGSITKTFTGAAIMQLQAEGKLAITDKLSQYLPDYPNGNQISLNDLFAHTSGIYDYKNFLYTKDGPDKVDFTRPVSKDRIVAMFSSQPTTSKPGGKEHYTNSGYFLLGLVIEKVTGKPFEAVIREQFINPLHLTQTGFDFVNLHRLGKTTPYTLQGDSVRVLVTPIDSTAGYAAGGMFSTVGDLYRWTQALQAERVLNPADWKQTLTPIGKTNWGYGWGVNTFKTTNDLVFQNGNLPGFATYLMLFPKTDMVIIALANTDDAADLTSLEPIVRDLVFISADMPYQIPKNRKAITLNESILRQYIGKYQLDKKRILAITFENEKLFLQVTGQGKLEIFPETETDFFLSVVDAQLTFYKNESGQVTHVVIHQNGDTVAKRQ